MAAGLPDDGFEQRHLELRGRTEPVDVLVLGVAMLDSLAAPDRPN